MRTAIQNSLMRTTSLFRFRREGWKRCLVAVSSPIFANYSRIVETAMLSDAQRDRTNANCLPHPVLLFARHFSVMAKETRTRARACATSPFERTILIKSFLCPGPISLCGFRSECVIDYNRNSLDWERGFTFQRSFLGSSEGSRM
jgi:hypothetical protein